MLKIALLILSLAEDGATRVTLSTTKDAEGCEDLKAVVTSILEDNGTKVIAAMCGDSPIELTPFEHGAGPEEEVHRYRVILSGDASYKVEPLTDDAACTPAPDQSPAVYCARSSQAVLSM